MIECPRCKLPQENEHFCEYCDFRLSSEYKPNNSDNDRMAVRLVLGIGIIFIGILLFGMLIFRTPKYIPAPINRDPILELSNRTGADIDEVRRGVDAARRQGYSKREALKITEEAIRFNDAVKYRE